MLVFDEQMFDADAAKWWTDLARMDRVGFRKAGRQTGRSARGAGPAPLDRCGERRDIAAGALEPTASERPWRGAVDTLRRDIARSAWLCPPSL